MGITHVYATLEESLGIPTVKQFGPDAHHVSSQDGAWVTTGAETTQSLDEITGKVIINQRTIVEWQGDWYVVYGKPAEGETNMRTLALLQKQDNGGYIVEGDEAVIKALPNAKPVEEAEHTADSEISRRKIGTMAAWDGEALTAKIEKTLTPADKLAVTAALTPAEPEKRIR